MECQYDRNREARLISRVFVIQKGDGAIQAVTFEES